MEIPRLLAIDFDETLAHSFEEPGVDMVDLVARILTHMPIAIVTGRDFAHISKGFLPILEHGPGIEKLWIFPDTAAQCVVWRNGVWQSLYAIDLSDEERTRIKRAIEEVVAETGALTGLPIFGQQYIDRNGQVSFAALGMEVPESLRHTWDPGNVRRLRLQESLQNKLPEYGVVFGGATTIDITHKGVDKAYAIRWLSQELSISPSEMLYIGDALYPGGNDYPVIATGIRTQQVASPSDTYALLEEMLESLSV